MPEAPVRTRITDPPHLQALYELAAAEHAMRQVIEALLPPQMGLSHFEVLRDFLRYGDGASPAEIADRQRMSRGAVTHLLQRMESLGWIRIEADDRDGRRKQVRITAPGAEAARSAVVALRAPTDHLRNSLNDNYLQEGAGFLADLRRALETFSPDDAPSGSLPGRR